jgi:hypothetical protein
LTFLSLDLLDLQEFLDHLVYLELVYLVLVQTLI